MTLRIALLIVLGLVVTSCGEGVASEAEEAGEAPAPAGDAPAEGKVVDRIDDDGVRESSGVVASRKQPGVYWTHNDSGNAPVLFAMTREGEVLGGFPVSVRNDDWEDVAADDEGHLFIGDVGNNNGGRRQVMVYRVDEPDPRAKPARSLRVRALWRLTYPGRPFDCEALFVHAGHGYLVSKVPPGLRADVYRFDLSSGGGAAKLEHVTTLPVRSPVTAADLSPDGGRLAVMTVSGPYVFRVNGDVASAGAEGAAEPWHVNYLDLSIEGVCFTDDGRGLLATTEDREVVYFPCPAEPESSRAPGADATRDAAGESNDRGG